MEMFIKEEYCVYDELFLLTGASWEAEEELEKNNIKVEMQSNDRITTIIKKYKCEICFREFIYKSSLLR